jgi:nucleotide-binding universal stress UspA family protein
MAIRKIMVPLTGIGSDARALAAALRVAKLEGAHVDGIYLRPDPADAVPYVGDAASAAIVEDLYQATKAAADRAAAAARQTVESAAQAAGVSLRDDPLGGPQPSVRFVDKMGTVAGVATAKSRLSDLIVTADVNDNPPLLAAFEAVLIGARRPVLVAPKADGTPAEALVVYLGLHGITAAAESFEGKGKSVGAALLERAEGQRADLLVMGGYGHSRLREFILGGVTRHMIAHARLAVLYGH